MVDVSKLISLGNLLVRKVTWFVLTTMSASLILSCAFGADCMTRIAYIYSRFPRTHSLTFWLPETVLSLSLSLSLSHFDFQRQYSLSLSLSLSHFDFQRQYSLSLSHFDLQRQNSLSLSHFDFQRQYSLSFSLSHILTYRDSTLSLSLSILT